MLVIRAAIMFFAQDGSFKKTDGISALNILRPAFNFGEGLLFSGTIMNNSYEIFLYQKRYEVKVEFPTIEGEAYEVIRPILNKGMNLNIQTASKVIGKAELLDFTYQG